MKIKAVLSRDELVAILDGDTYVEPSYLANLIASRCLPTVLRADVSIYNTWIDALLPLASTFPSYIVNFGIVDARLVRNIIPNLDDWFIKQMDAVTKVGGAVDISEYQLFGRLMRNNGWINKRALIFRRADLLVSTRRTIDQTTRLCLKHYQIVAFEWGHKSNALRRLAARLALGVRYSW